MNGSILRAVAIGCATGGALVGALPTPASAQGPPTDGTPPPPYFQTADQCMACHNGLVTPSGEDISIGSHWRSSMMANSARDPYWQAGVRRETLDHPEARAAIEAECSICHMPMARFEAVAAGGQGEVFAHLPVRAATTREDRLAADGVSCTVCHQIQDERLGEEESFTGRFHVDTTRAWGRRDIFGPFRVDSGRMTLMRSATGFEPGEADHVRSSELCATCHTLYTHSLGPGGEVIGELPEQVPYLEWRHSAYRSERGCQDCHMPVVRDSVPVTGVMGRRRAEVSRHSFRGGNFFMPRMLARYRGELGVQALTAELAGTADRTEAFLKDSAAVVSLEAARRAGGRLRVDVEVTNLAGHKLPTAYPSRRAWLHVTVRDGQGSAVFESGALAPGGWIEGNDNDEDPARYEPHHTEITEPGQVQVYEAIMVGPDDAVTTGLLTAVRYAKDNRVLPRGFDKATAGEDIAVRGRAAEDADFTGGGDRVRYWVDPAGAEGPFTVEAELWYQPIAYRWAQNLRGYEAPEPERFVGCYQAMASGSAVRLARDSATVE